MTKQHHTLINIGRSFGSGGGLVAKCVGKLLDIPVYDNELISKVAEESGHSRTLFSGKDEKESLFSVSSFFASGRLGYIDSGYVNDNVLFNIQSEVIQHIADKGDAIFIGRCADYILRNKGGLSVFICAEDNFRIHRLMQNEGLDEDQAENLMRRKDRTRATYYNYYTFGNWGEAANYDLCVDSSVLGIEGTAQLVVDFGRRAGKIEK